MLMWSVTVNVGGGPGHTARRAEGMSRWAEQVARGADRPSVVFAQEVPSDDWLRIWADAGYAVSEGVGARWRIRSALITASTMQVTPLSEAEAPTLTYHGSYLVAARWQRPEHDIILVSAHASPQRADLSTYPWPDDRVPVPAARHGGGDPRWPADRLWDSDMVLATISHMQEVLGPVIVGGDFNESRRDDLINGNVSHGWGHEYFDRAESLGLADVSLAASGAELPTRGGLQLDHVLVSSGLLLGADGPDPYLDPMWATSDPDDLSDHVALWVPLPVAVT